MANNNNNLTTHVRSHRYQSNVAIDSYLVRQRETADQNNDIVTVRQSPVSRKSSTSSLPPPETVARMAVRQSTSPVVVNRIDDEVDSSDGHERCITPAPANNTDPINCCICFAPVVNGFRCTTVAERMAGPPLAAAVNDYYVPDYQQVHHFACYRCIARNMVARNRPVVNCPVGCVNEFNVQRLVPMNLKHTMMTDKLFIYCENNCGLGGSPLALANHLCPLAPVDDIGHTYRSTELQRLHTELQELIASKQLVEHELRHVLRNYNVKRSENHALYANNQLLMDQNKSLFEQINYLYQQLSQLEYQMLALRAQSDTMRQQFNREGRAYRKHLKQLAKQSDVRQQELKVKIDELRKQKSRLIHEFRLVLNRDNPLFPIDVQLSADNQMDSSEDSSPDCSVDIQQIFASNNNNNNQQLVPNTANDDMLVNNTDGLSDPSELPFLEFLQTFANYF
ncbi:uncharacterized protein LOC128951505 [Oppia nitens]|uniref:uncharacterized protein LOC128951505 n=1 Tax=Oppia nitens TaxID=1686743 RepID=UPI0023DB41EE|nr:uncharacterized protein LOC128951505 [Oppia nitens]